MRSVVVVAGIVLLIGCSKPKLESVAPTVYDAAAVERRDIKVTVDAAGVLEPESVVEVKSQAAGEVLNVHADIGDVVQEKALLIEIDKRTPRNKVAEAEAALAAAKARRTIAKTQLDRADMLFKSQTLTQADVEKAQLEFAQSDAQVVSATVTLENARITLDDTDVRAPITGTILEKTVEPGTVISSSTSNVNGGAVLMKMADLTAVQVRTRVDETDIGKIKPGMLTKVTVAAYPNQPFEGTVLKVEPQAIVEQNVTMFSVLIKLPNPGGVLKPGMNADVTIEVADRNSVAAVPTAALRADSDVELTAKMLGMDEAALRRQIWPDSEAGAKGASGKNMVKLPNGREVALPDGVDAAKVAALMEKRRAGQELTAEDRTLMRQVFQQAGGGFGGGGGGGEGFARGGGGGGPPGGFQGGGGPPGGFQGGGGFGGGGGFAGGGRTGGAAAAAARSTDYLFNGNYWVIALRNDQPVPLAVKTGLTDLDYSEIVSGLEPGDKVLLLPSASLYEQQERLQQFITQRFASSTPFQQQGAQNIPRNFR